MFFELHDSKNGIIKSISIDMSKLDKNACDHLKESLKNKVKIIENKIVIKTHMTLDSLKILNDGYLTFHSQFITENVIVPSKHNVKLMENQENLVKELNNVEEV